MDDICHLQWPVEMLGRILHFLAMDGAACTWTHLAYLTHKNDALKNISKKMERPLVLRVGFNGQEEDKVFFLPFRNATVAQIEIDWGDDTPLQIITEVGDGYAEHEYTAAGEYTVRVFPHHGTRLASAVWLDHVGLRLHEDHTCTSPWWSPLRSLDTLGSLGISSLEGLFYEAETIHASVSQLDVSRISSMRGMFSEAQSFNQPIGRWNVSNVTDMSRMFYSCHLFDCDISRWDVSRVKSMESMFHSAKTFNQPLGGWDTSHVTDMSGMFSYCDNFNQDISRWNVSNVENMELMFFNAVSFNTPIGGWDVSRVKKMSCMFGEARSFNQPIGGWDISSVTDLSQMFAYATEFKQDISGWKVSNLVRTTRMFAGATSFSPKCIDRWNLTDEQLRRLFH